ncbi:MAG: formate dehydrogenase accessory protein FdhE [Desulfamplus sp.]|nr:formate dehydrogenase accessory protein FdhE [Desulfamplus sp.]
MKMVANCITLEQIKKSASSLKVLRPAYKEFIDFYEEFFIAQEEAKTQIDLDEIVISPTPAPLPNGEGQNNYLESYTIPLITTSDFVIFPNQAELLFEKLCKIAEDKGSPSLSGAAEKIALLLFSNSSQVESYDQTESYNQIESYKKIESIFKALLDNDHKILEITAQSLELNKEALTFLGFAAISPYIQICAAHLSQYLKPDSQIKSAQEKLLWNKGYCPICGTSPQMGYFNQNGDKYLICSFCQHSWKTSRMGCPLCENREKGKQHYFFNEEEKEYRVDLCDKCGKYIKVIDLREMTRDFYPPLEMLCTLHLDMQATEKGYISVLAK